MIALYIILGWIFVAVLASIVLYFNKERRMTSGTKGVIETAEESETMQGPRRLVRTRVTCSFAIHGKEFRVAKDFAGRNDGRFPIGRALAVKYNPADPKMSMIAVR